jgi:hypothetical protein
MEYGGGVGVGVAGWGEGVWVQAIGWKGVRVGSLRAGRKGAREGREVEQAAVRMVEISKKDLRR